MATMDIHRAYKFRFYPTQEQEENLIRTWGRIITGETRVVQPEGKAT